MNLLRLRRIAGALLNHTILYRFTFPRCEPINLRADLDDGIGKIVLGDGQRHILSHVPDVVGEDDVDVWMHQLAFRCIINRRILVSELF